MAQSVKIPDELMAVVRPEAERHSRSVAGQLAHWAKIGRAIERSGRFSYDRIDAALQGSLLPEELTEEESAIWADEFMKVMSAPSADEVGFFAERRVLGRGVGLDENGTLVRAEKRDANEER